MSSTTFFGNRAIAKILHTWVAGTYTMTTGSTAFTGAASVGDYVWIKADGVQFACKVTDVGTLAYKYKGAGGVGVDGYRCTPITLQVLRGLEVNFNWETAKLWGTDSIIRVDEAKYQFEVETKARYCKWDPGVTVDWMFKVLRPTGATGAVENTNTCYVNGVVYSILGSDAGSNLEIVCGRTFWDNVPYPLPENEFMIRDLTGHAADATVDYFYSGT